MMQLFLVIAINDAVRKCFVGMAIDTPQNIIVLDEEDGDACGVEEIKRSSIGIVIQFVVVFC